MNFKLFSEPLWDWDECLYAVNSREMRETGHFLSNIWNGYLDFQKPPGYSWLLQIPYSFGINEFTTRILSVIFGLLLLVAVYFFTKKYFSKKAGLLAVLILLASELFAIYSQHANTDIGYTLLIFLGVWTWILSFKKYRFSYLSGLLFGLAVMIKGIGSIQFLMAIFVSIFLNFKKEKLYNFFRLIAVFLAIAVPWHIAAYKTFGYEFFRVYVLENIVKRGKYPIEFHRERWWFYFVLIYRELFPWILFGIAFPVKVISNMVRDLARKREIKFAGFFAALRMTVQKNELLFTILLLIFIPLLSLIRFRTKIAWYALPLYPFIAIYLAHNIEFIFKKIKLSWFIYVIAILIALDAGQLLVRESILPANFAISPRYQVAKVIKKYPQKELHYLVAPPERQAREILPPEEQIPQTWIFGGNACMVFYSHKKVHYYYFVEEFQRKLSSEGLFLIDNRDLTLMENVSKKILYRNSEFTVFEI